VEEFEQDKMMADAATEVGFSALAEVMNYYADMLILCFDTIAALSGQTPGDVRRGMEESLGLTGTLERTKKQLRASNEIVADLLSKMREE